jgi:glycosyltransferase involved in cell wall biosynthesis
MASGLPVIATAVGGNLELVREGATGFLVPTSNAAAMSAALLAYASDADKRTSHGRAARALAEERYSLRVMLAAYESLYREHCAQLGEAAA